MINVPKLANICWPIPCMYRFNFKQPEILGSIVGQKKLHLLTYLLMQQHQPDLNVDGSSIPLLLFNT